MNRYWEPHITGSVTPLRATSCAGRVRPTLPRDRCGQLYPSHQCLQLWFYLQGGDLQL